MSTKRTAIVALGGNAISRPEQEDNIANQFANVRASLEGIVELAREGYNLVLTHGNGPQVGNCLLRVELARGKAPILPLGVLVADTEGGMGYMIEQSLQNRLRHEKINRPVVTIITQMIVDRNDPAIANPSKFVGQFYSEEEARLFSEARGWQMKKDADRGWRRVVPSPKPIAAVETDTIRTLVESGTIVLAGGGGGIPVYIDEDGNLEGLDAVIDKDFASAVLGRAIGAQVLSILTGVDKVAIHFGTPDQVSLDKCSVGELKQYFKDGHFPAGSMGPKIQAAIAFIEQGGEMVTISSFVDASRALRGEAGTMIVP